jgi:hypothetical protein
MHTKEAPVTVKLALTALVDGLHWEAQALPSRVLLEHARDDASIPGWMSAIFFEVTLARSFP